MDQIAINIPRQMYDDIGTIAAKYGRTADQELRLRLAIFVATRLDFDAATGNQFIQAVL